MQVLEVKKKRAVQSNESKCPYCKSIGDTYSIISHDKSIQRTGSVVKLLIGCNRCYKQWFNEYKFFRKKNMDGKIIEPAWAKREG